MMEMACQERKNLVVELGAGRRPYEPFGASQPLDAQLGHSHLNRYVNVTIEDLEAVPKERKINNKSLESDIALTAADVGAAEINHSHKPQEISGAEPAQAMSR
jgi:hypothetical protein